MDRSRARVALLTPPGRGALAVVAVAGPAAEERVSRLFVPRGVPLEHRPDGAIVFGRWTGGVDAPGEDVVVVRRGADSLEIHCHGGIAASEAVIAGVVREGAVRQTWPEWLRAGGVPEIEVEAREALAAAGGPKAAQILSRQLAGSLEAELGRVTRLHLEGRGDEANAAIARLAGAARVGLRLARPWRVVLAGSVNAGKSSLVNAIAGFARSIVSPEPGTTRDLLATRVVLDGWEVDLIDVAGERDGDAAETAVTETERTGIARAVAAREEADLVLRVLDGLSVGTQAPLRGARAHVRELLVASKADLCRSPDTGRQEGVVWTSSVTGAGIDDLIAEIVRRLVPEQVEDPGLLAGPVPFTERHMAILKAMWTNDGRDQYAAPAR